MRLTFHLDPEPDDALCRQVCALWADVTNAGGAVGFVPPATAEDVRPEMIKYLASMAEGRTRLVVGRDGNGRVVATAFIGRNTHRLKRHWCGLHTVMIHPDLQGRGCGRQLMTAAEQAVRAMDGMRAIQLTCRGGLGLEHFYASCGYKEVGRVPDAIKVAEDDYRDDITMWLPL